MTPNPESNWLVISSPDSADRVHVVPGQDPRGKHEESRECWCDPDLEYLDPDTELPYEEGPLVIHNAPPGYPGQNVSEAGDPDARPPRD